MRPLNLFAAAAIGGAALGAASRFAAPGDARRSVTALVAAFGVVVCVAAARTAAGESSSARLRSGGVVAAAAAVAAWCAAAAAGGPSMVGASAVVAGAGVAAFGVATLLRARGVGGAHAALLGAAVPFAAAALIFVADPFIEWNGSTTAAAPARAAFVYSANPIASIAADAGIDWQREKWLYSGPGPGASSLTVTGEYYPSAPATSFAWGLAAAALGAAALVVARPRAPTTTGC